MEPSITTRLLGIYFIATSTVIADPIINEIFRARRDRLTSFLKYTMNEIAMAAIKYVTNSIIFLILKLFVAFNKAPKGMLNNRNETNKAIKKT